jgi:hypothetical protein
MNTGTIANSINYVKQAGTDFYNKLPDMAPGAAILLALDNLPMVAAQDPSTKWESPQFIVSMVAIGLATTVGLCVAGHKIYKECCAESREDKLARLSKYIPPTYSQAEQLKYDPDNTVDMFVEYKGEGLRLKVSTSSSSDTQEWSDSDDEVGHDSLQKKTENKFVLDDDEAVAAASSMTTPVKGQTDIGQWTASGTPVHIAERYPVSIDLLTPSNPDRNRRPKDLCNRNIYTPVQSNTGGFN